MPLPDPKLLDRLRAEATGLDGTRSAGLVLIVDDVPDNLAVLHDALDAAGYTVLVATDGASALPRAMITAATEAPIATTSTSPSISHKFP